MTAHVAATDVSATDVGAIDVSATDAALPPGTTLPPTAVLETLTDEELAVLALGGSAVVTPYLSSVEPRHRAPLLRTAYRGLVARGIVDPPTTDARRRARAEALEGDPAVAGIDVSVREDVLTLVTLRRAARAVVAMARTTALLQDYLYVHAVEDVLLVEEVSSDGIHRFALRALDDLGETVVAAAVHPQAGDAEGPPVAVTPATPDDPSPPDEILFAAGQALVRCDLTVLAPGRAEPVLLGLFSAPAGSWLFETPRGLGCGVVARPVTADDLRRAVEDALRDVREHAR